MSWVRPGGYERSVTARRSLISASLARALALTLTLTLPAAAQPAYQGAAGQTVEGGLAKHGPTAAQAAPARAVTFEEAIRRAAEGGPGVELARSARSSAVDARAAAWQALVYAPTLSVEAGRRSGGFGPGTELAVSVQQSLSLHGLGRQRREAATALLDAAGTDVQRARLAAAGAAAMAWVAAVEAREALGLRAASLAEATRAAEVAHARVASGAAQPLEQALADGDRAIAQAAVIEAEGDQVEALAELRHALGFGPDEPIEAAGSLRDGASELDAPLDERATGRAVEASHPAILAAHARSRLAHADARLAGAQSMPALGIGGQYRLEGTGDRVWTATLTLPLPIVDPGAFARARLEAEAAASEARARLLKGELARDVRLALHDRHHYRELRDALAQRAIVPLADALRIAQAQLSVGAADVSPVLMARQRLLAAQEQLVRADAQARRADVRLAELTGSLARAAGGRLMFPFNNASPTTPRRWPLAALALALVAAGAAGCRAKVVPERAAQAASAPPAASARAARVKIEPSLIEAGRVVTAAPALGSGARLSIAAEAEPGPDGEAEVGALVTGRVARLLAAEGSRVKKGEALAWVDAPEAARAAADLLRARARASVSSRKLARQTELLSQQATSQAAVDEVGGELAAARADIGAALTLLRSLGGLEPGASGDGSSGGPSRVPVRSPIAGVVVRRDAVLGGPVSPDRSLFRIVAPDRTIVVGKLPETAGPPPADGTPAVISPRGAAAPSGERGPCEARIEGTVALLDPASRTYPLRARPLGACPWLMPGAFVELALAPSIPTGNTVRIFVPREAVVEVHGAQIVFVPLAEAGAFEARTVRTGEGAGELIRLDDGLSAGEPLVVRGALLLKGELMRAELGGE
jgi:RND family efflux transporter MFP subunit